MTSHQEVQEAMCEVCGGTGSVRVHGPQDYGVSFESELCDQCDYGRELIAADVCVWEGHDWEPVADFKRCRRCGDEAEET